MSPLPSTAPRAAPGHRPPVAPADSATVEGRSTFRADIEGLRAVAVTLVVVYHAWPGAVGGGFVGVDAFFVISGYLITGHLISGLQSGGRIGFADFYARRVRRILPAATLTLIVVLVVSWLVLPAIRFQSESVDSMWASVFGLNVHLAIEGTNYLNASVPPSPIQNFWSLSVEEQFYAVWPLVLLGATTLLSGRTRHRHRARTAFPWTLAAAIAAIFAVSLVVDLRLTAESPPWAYYSLFSRAWELAAGAGLVLAVPYLRRVPRRFGAALAWAGLLALLLSALVLNDGTRYPGTAALWPVAATAAVIAGGVRSAESPRRGVNAVLGTVPFQAVGRLSYSWYLWHYPALILAPYLFHVQALPIGVNLLVALLSLGMAAVAFRFVEQPLRRARWLTRRPRNALAFGALLVAASVSAALVIPTLPAPWSGTAGIAASGKTAAARASLPPPTSDAQIQADLARSLRITTVPSDLTPSLAGAANDEPVVYRDGCHLGQPVVVAPSACVFGDVSSPVSVVLFGDSHAAQWFPTLDAISLKEHWRLVSMTKASCPAADVPVYNPYFKRIYTECDTWRTDALRAIVRLHPKLVVVSSRRDYGATTFPDDSQSFLTTWKAGITTTLHRFRSVGIDTLLIEDTPHPSTFVPDCLATNPESVSSCTLSASSADEDNDRRLADESAAAALGATYLDPTPWFCTTGGCPVIVGTTLVYRDDQHMTVAYARWLVPLLEGVVTSAMDK
jgi:peptidoglycan/LPS O-acetylase OafA/YrhL